MLSAFCTAQPSEHRSARVRSCGNCASQKTPRVVLLALPEGRLAIPVCLLSAKLKSTDVSATMLPAALLRHPGLRRLVLQARTYAQAAASPAPAAGPGQMSFTFASPTQVFFDGANVRQVDVPTLTGAFGILASHVPTLQVLRPGLVVVHAEDGTTTKYFVSSGSVTVNADSSVQLLAEEVVTLDMLDLGAARANLEKAQSELSGAADEAARAEIQIRIEANEALVKALE
ncbi:ATP synthase subunit delta, mitochondrial isoform X1 [Rattus norvegicus]|uniref:ATP synthase F(1) complex subunit delta, mitochondrial n=2 Tax=Rattus norvegicus TaxID=10116 RepID=G3V7Y3_RAT|nr:ATP synthase subunit delta, mitochondrial isoform X1 [Rattus norvegicus]|eukprot:XP_006240907.1 PREDICTED: ATP synthase subunit delta, mitochondrial isoform X1 [Rattus norvegicus]